MTLLRSRPRRGYRGRSAEQLQAERRRRLLDAGLQLISAKGYAALTIGELCRTARVSPRHFYELFNGREALLRTLFDELVAESRSRIFATLKGDTTDDAAEVPTSAREATSRALDAVAVFVRYVLANPARARLAFVEVVGVSPRMEAHRRKVISSFVDLIADAASTLALAGRLPKAQYRLAAVALVGATNEMIVDWLSHPGTLDALQMERAIVSVYRTLIEGAAARSG